GVWAMRVLMRRKYDRVTALGRWWRPVSSALACWLLFGSLTSLSPQRSLAWSVVFGSAFLAAGAAAESSEMKTRQAFERAWLWSALVFGALGCAEGLTHWNPLAPHYKIDGSAITQHWSVYRIETTLGHPLVNAMVFATLGAGAAMIALARPTRFSAAAALCS